MPLPSSEHDRTPFHTWAALLAHCTQLARVSAGLPRTAEGERWRRSVAPIVSITAAGAALGMLDRLPEEERAVGLVRAEVLIDESERTLGSIWEAAGLPGEVVGVIADGRRALGEAVGSAADPPAADDGSAGS